jgi:hypothetical protein
MQNSKAASFEDHQHIISSETVSLVTALWFIQSSRVSDFFEIQYTSIDILT